MRISGRDEVALRRAEKLPDPEFRAYYRLILDLITQNGHGKDFPLPVVEPFMLARSETQGNGNDLFGEYSLEESSFVPWEGPPRIKSDKRYRMTEPPRMESRSRQGLCQFDEHPIDIGAPIWVAHAIDLLTGRKVDLWGCSECASIIIESLLQRDRMSLA